MLKYMTKESFIQAVEQNRFAVQSETDTRYAIYYIGNDELGNMFLHEVINPETKSGKWNCTGGNYNKYIHALEIAARWVDANAEDKDTNPQSAYEVFMSKQRYNRI